MFLRSALLSLGTSWLDADAAGKVVAAAGEAAGCALPDVACAKPPLEAIDALDDAPDSTALPPAQRPWTMSQQLVVFRSYMVAACMRGQAQSAMSFCAFRRCRCHSRWELALPACWRPTPQGKRRWMTQPAGWVSGQERQAAALPEPRLCWKQHPTRSASAQAVQQARHQCQQTPQTALRADAAG